MKDALFLFTLWLIYLFDLPFYDEDISTISRWDFWNHLSLSDFRSPAPWEYSWQFIDGEWQADWEIPF